MNAILGDLLGLDAELEKPSGFTDLHIEDGTRDHEEGTHDHEEGTRDHEEETRAPEGETRDQSNVEASEHRLYRSAGM